MVPARQLRAAIVEQARRGLRLRVLLRGLLVAFVLVAVTVVPPARNATACYLVAGAYALWVASIAAGSWRAGAAHGPPARSKSPTIP